ncbi:MAG: HAMP domain-containing histidine kinase [Chromatiales bacterium]|nr:HAMP domain-containing histidine kinase [Chromatiales bacterium]
MSTNTALSRLFSRSAPPMSIGVESTWRPLHLFNLYRFTLSSLFILIYQLNDGAFPPPLGMMLPKLFYLASLSYLIFSLLAMVFIAKRKPSFSWQRNIHVLADIVFITALLYSSGGVASGMGMLLVVTVAFASMLSAGREPLLFAALASLMILGEETLAFITLSGASINYTQAGILGIALFTTAIIAHILARRARESEALAAQRSIDLANMAQLADYTIQQMRTGVIAVNKNSRVELINSAAWRLLSSPMVPTHSMLELYNPELDQLHKQWLQGKLSSGTTLSPQHDCELLPQFQYIGDNHSAGTLIFLEDASATAQQAQQLKLASLGRLTASIAHEIRNPLGAVSHAADLLAEAPELAVADQRLLAIIKSHTQRINTIIEDVLKLGRRDQSHGELFHLSVWLENFCTEFLQGHGVPAEALQCRMNTPESSIFFDPNHLRQILTNLTQNGLRHASSASNPRVEIVAGSQDKEWGYIDIIDHGPGISEEARSHIFEPFYTTEPGGTGLGLYIAQELASCNQGKLRYEPNEEHPSRFRLHFPKQRRTIE